MSEQNTDINSRIDRIEVTLTHVTDAIEKMAKLIDQLNRPQDVKWGPILTAISLLFIAGGGYTTLITMPMQREADDLQAQIMALEERELERERDLGRIEGKLGIKIDD